MQLVYVKFSLALSSMLRWYKMHKETILWFSLSIFKRKKTYIIQKITTIKMMTDFILSRLTNLGKMPTLIISERILESNERLSNRRRVMLSRASSSCGIKRAKPMTIFSSLILFLFSMNMLSFFRKDTTKIKSSGFWRFNARTNRPTIFLFTIFISTFISSDKFSNK